VTKKGRQTIHLKRTQRRHLKRNQNQSQRKRKNPNLQPQKSWKLRRRRAERNRRRNSGFCSSLVKCSVSPPSFSSSSGLYRAQRWTASARILNRSSICTFSSWSWAWVSFKVNVSSNYILDFGNRKFFTNSFSHVAILIYRFMRGRDHSVLKYIHAGLQILSGLFGAIGVWAAFYFHASAKIPDMYSLHSWIGLPTLIFFFGQWIIACDAYLFPGRQEGFRKTLLPVHIYLGLIFFTLSIGK